MSKTAKISLTADVAGFKKSIAEAKGLLESVGRVKISDSAMKQMESGVLGGLKKQAKGIEDAMRRAEETVNNLSKASSKSFDVSKLNQATSALEKLKAQLKEIQQLEAKIQSNGLASAGGGSGGLGGLMKGSLGGFGKMASLVGLGFGVEHLMSVATNRANQRNQIRALTGGSDVSDFSKMGYTPSERLDHALEIASVGGKKYSTKEISHLTDMSETAARAYGIPTQTSASAIGAAAHSGQDQAKFLGGTIGTAVAAKLAGSKIGEYLQMIMSATGEMAQNANVDGGSLNGFAGLLSKMDFFKNDPSRTGRAISGINSSFSNGDRYQQAQASRAIISSMGGNASVGDVETRRGMGIFSQASPEELGQMKKAGFSQSYMKMRATSGQDILQNLFKDVMENSGVKKNDKGKYNLSVKDTGNIVQMVKSKLGVTDIAAEKMLLEYIHGGSFSKKSMKEAERGGMSPQAQLDMTFRGTEAKIAELNRNIGLLTKELSGPLSTVISDLTNALLEKSGAVDGLKDPDAGKLGSDTGGVGGWLASAVEKTTGMKNVGQPLSYGPDGPIYSKEQNAALEENKKRASNFLHGKSGDGSTSLVDAMLTELKAIAGHTKKSAEKTTNGGSKTPNLPVSSIARGKRP